MRLPSSLVAESFTPPGDGELDFAALGAPRPLRPRPVATDADAEAGLQTDLAWFWNTNSDWAEEQIAACETYEAAVARMVAAVGLRARDRVALPGSLPDARLAAWQAALPEGVETAVWRPRRDGLVALEDLQVLLDDRMRLVLLTKACPVTGALNEVIPVAQFLLLKPLYLAVEASHFVARGSLDIRNLRCDGVIASGAELFGARGAVLWSRRLGSDSAGPADEGIAPGTLTGLVRAVSYAERLGGTRSAPVAPPSERFGRREAMRRGMQGIRQEERTLSRIMLRGLERLRGLSVIGENDPRRAAYRTPEFTFVCEGAKASDLGAGLAAEGVRVASGDLGCSALLKALGMDPEAGVVRASLAHYHRREDVERFLRVLGSLI